MKLRQDKMIIHNNAENGFLDEVIITGELTRSSKPYILHKNRILSMHSIYESLLQLIPVKNY